MSANVALTDTFDQWRVKTNEIVVMTQTDGMSNFIKVLDTTNSTSNTTGSIITAGGVGIAKSAVIGENLRVHGNLITDGDTTISGNLVFGDAATDQVTFSADINSSLIPNANNTFNVGNTTMLWANTWTGHLGVTQKSDSGKAAVAITSLDTDQIGISVAASQVDADVLDITSDAVTTAKVIDITADSLTTGSALYIDSDSDSTGTRSIASIIQNHASATGATGLTVQSDAGRGIFIDTNLAAGGYALEIDSEQTTTNVAKIASIATSGTIIDVAAAGALTGSVMTITADAATTGTLIETSADALTTGTIANFASDSSTTGTRTLVKVTNDNTAATGTTPLVVKQDSTNIAAKFDAQTTVVIPVGTTAQRGTAVAGGIRYNSEISSFEGYSGSSWGSLGGLIDVDQDTKIIAETSAGADNDDLDFYTAGVKRMSIDQAGVINVGVDDTGYDVKFFGDTASRYWLWDTSADGVKQKGTLTVGVDDAGYDVQFFGDTASRYWLWDTSADGVVQRGTLSVGVDDTGHDVKFFGATASKYWLWDESADQTVLIGSSTQTGNAQLTGTLTVGVDNTGHDVKLFGATASKYWLWDESADKMIIAGDAAVTGATTLTGTTTQIGALTVGVDDTGHDVKLFGATAGSFMLWNQATDSLHLTDSSPIKLGDAQDLTMYHDGSHSYITNAVGALKLATETSGIAVSIGHTTSETTVNDNLTVTGDLTINGTTSTINSATLTVDDKNIELGSVATPSDTTADGGGFTLKGATDKTILWVNATDTWDFNQGIKITGASTFTGNAQLTGTLTVGVNDTGHDVKFFGATSGSYALWDESADTLLLTDSTPLEIGDSSDMTLYHDGTNSHITNKTGVLKIANATTGIAVLIGHATSETTVGDNLTVTGDLTESSMREMKTNISNIENILPAVLQMQGVSFDWKNDEEPDSKYGFIAEDVHEILPNLVSYKEGKPHGVQYSKMTAVLLEAIKEQQVQIDELKAKLN